MLQALVILYGKLSVSLLKDAIDHDVFDIADIGMQHDCSNGIGPAEEAGGAAVPDEQVCFGMWGQDTNVWAAEGEAAVASCEEEGLVDGHWVAGGEVAAVYDFGEEGFAGGLEPEAGLGEDVGGEGEVGVYAEGGLVHDEVAVWVEVAVVHFGFRGRGDEVVVLAEELGVRGGVVAGVGEDDGDGGVEEVEGLEDGGEVGGAVDAAIGVRG